jgi:hypothetical protein
MVSPHFSIYTSINSAPDVKIHGLWPIANEDSSDSINGKLMGMGAMWLLARCVA